MGKYVRPKNQRAGTPSTFRARSASRPQLYPPLSPGMKRLLGAGDKTAFESNFPKAEVQEFWRKDDSVNDQKHKVWMGPQGATLGILG